MIPILGHCNLSIPLLEHFTDSLMKMYHTIYCSQNNLMINAPYLCAQLVVKLCYYFLKVTLTFTRGMEFTIWTTT